MSQESTNSTKRRTRGIAFHRLSCHLLLYLTLIQWSFNSANTASTPQVGDVTSMITQVSPSSVASSTPSAAVTPGSSTTASPDDNLTTASGAADNATATAAWSSTTTQVPPTTASLGCPNSTLNATEEQYVLTEITLGPNDVANQCEFERKLARVCVEAFNRANSSAGQPSTRRKRAITESAVTVQMVSMRKNDRDLEMIYYVIRNDKVVDATLMANVIGYLHEQEVAMILGHVVKVVAKPYVQPVVQREDPKYWIIGVVLGGVVLLIGIIWCVLFLYIKCCRDPVPQKNRNSYSNRSLQAREDMEKGRPQVMKMTPSKQKGVDIVRTEVGLADQKSRSLSKLNDNPQKQDGRTASNERRPDRLQKKSPKKKKVPTATLR